MGEVLAHALAFAVCIQARRVHAGVPGTYSSSLCTQLAAAVTARDAARSPNG